MTLPSAASPDIRDPLPSPELPTLSPPPNSHRPAPSLPSAAPRKNSMRRMLLGMAGLLLLAGLGAGAGVATGLIPTGGMSKRSDLIVHPVKYERLQLTITERGQLEAAENSDIVCRVKAR